MKIFQRAHFQRVPPTVTKQKHKNKSASKKKMFDVQLNITANWKM